MTATSQRQPLPIDPLPGGRRAESRACRDRLLEEIDRVAADLEGEAEACEAAGRLTDRALELLRGTGIGWSLVSRELGGYGMYPDDVFPLLERLARVDGSIGWISTIVASAGPLLAYLDPTVTDALLADGLPVFAVSGAPTGRAVLCEGGYRLTGSWAYSSAGLHADWVFCGGRVYDGDQPVDGPPRSFIVPASAVTQGGNWDTLGLRGTGSIDYTVTDQFVPENWTVNMFLPPTSSSPSAAGGMGLIIQLMHLGFAAGVTRRLLDEVAAQANKTPTRPGAARAADNPAFRTEYAEHELDARAGRALVAETLTEICDALDLGKTPTRRQITLLRGANVRMHEIAREIALWAFTKGGGTSLRAGTFQRVVRDTLAGGQHALVAHGQLAEVGYELLGAPPELRWSGHQLVGPPPSE